MTTEPISKKCIVSLGTKNSRYVDGLARLSNSLRDNASGIDFLGFIHEASVGAPLHTDHPYAFKVYAIQRAIDMGYTSVLWLDCSVWAVAPVHPIFDIIEQVGYWFEGAGCFTGEWTNKETLNHYEFTLDEALELPMIQSGFMGFNINESATKFIWKEFKKGCEAGLFNGSWGNHRHDQSVMSCVLNRIYAEFSHLPEYVQYAGIYDKIINDKIIFKCQGI